MLDAVQSDVIPVFFHLITAVLIWYIRPYKNVHAYATRIGTTNIAGLLTLLVLPNLWGHSGSRFSATMESANIVLAALTLWRFFFDSIAARIWTSAAILLCGLFLLVRHHEEFVGLTIGGCLASIGHLPDLLIHLRGATRFTPPQQWPSNEEEPDKQTFSQWSLPDVGGDNKIHTSMVSMRLSENLIEAEPTAMPFAEDVLNEVSMNPHQFSDTAFEEVVLLGKSSTRTTYKVRHTLTGAVYACKSMTPREMSVGQLAQALRPLRALKHANLVRCLGIYSMGYGEDDLKVVLEYHSGGNLGAIATRIKQAGGVIEETIMGRITEGVSESSISRFNVIYLWTHLRFRL